MILTYIETINYIKTNNFTQLSYCLVHQLFLYQSLIHGFRKPHWPFKAKMQRGLYMWTAVRGPDSPLTHLRVWLFCLTLGGPNSEAGFRNPVLILNCKTNCMIRDRLLPCSLSTLISSKCKMSRLIKRTNHQHPRIWWLQIFCQILPTYLNKLQGSWWFNKMLLRIMFYMPGTMLGTKYTMVYKLEPFWLIQR